MFRVYTTGRLGTRSDQFARIEDALEAADQRITQKLPGQSVKLEIIATGETYDEKGMVEIKRHLSQQ